MANKIQVKRGLKASLPTLSIGEYGFCTDTKELYIGSSTGNVKIAISTDLDSKINTSNIVNDLTTGGTAKVLSAEQGKVLDGKIGLINDKPMVSSTLTIVDDFKRNPLIEPITLNPDVCENYNAVSYGTPFATLVNDMVHINANINLKSTTSGRIGTIPSWLLPIRPNLCPTTAFSSDFLQTSATAYAIWNNNVAEVPYGEIRLEVGCIGGKSKFIGINHAYRAPFDDLNGDYDFTSKLNTVLERKATLGNNIPITILLGCDTHWSIPTGSETLISRQVRGFNWLSSKIGSNFNLILGDYMSEWDGLTAQGLPAMKKKWEAFRYMLKENTLLLKGNHDDASQVGLFDTTKVISTERMWDWSMEGKSSLNTNYLEPKNFYYYVDDYPSRTRHIMLNTIDIPYNTSGSNLYKGFDTFVVRQKQLTWLSDVALKVPTGWDVAVYSHHSFYEGITPTDVEVVNREVVKKILSDFVNGANSTTTGTNSTFPCTVTTSFASQGARKLIGCFFGHHHKDLIQKEGVINHVGIASMRPSNSDMTAPWNRVETGADSFCADCLQIDVVNKKVYLTRFGFNADRTFNY